MFYCTEGDKELAGKIHAKTLHSSFFASYVTQNCSRGTIISGPSSGPQDSIQQLFLTPTRSVGMLCFQFVCLSTRGGGVLPWY